MRFAFDEEQEALRRTARRFLEMASPSERVRAAMMTERGFDPELWRRIVDELGWPSLIIPEAYGGAGLGDVELAAIFEEAGRALLCAPLLSTVLATSTLLAAGSEAQKAEHLPRIAMGTITAALAWNGREGHCNAHGISMVVHENGDDCLLSGEASFVIDGHTADLLIVAAREPGSSGEAGIRLFAVPAATPGLDRRPLPTMDATRKLAALHFDAARVPRSARLPGNGWPALRRVLDRARVALAAEMLGGAERCLEMAIDYAKTRVQFGRPIGSFQAIKHELADLFVEVESSRSAAYYAAWAAATGDPELPALAALAKAYCADAFFHCAAENIQIHGGIGFTWEHDAHLFFKRARASGALLGDGAESREIVARAIGL